nr:MAG TPA: hypothetical protein [Caudoviricetes sp.]
MSIVNSEFFRFSIEKVHNMLYYKDEKGAYLWIPAK